MPQKALEACGVLAIDLDQCDLYGNSVLKTPWHHHDSSSKHQLLLEPLDKEIFHWNIWIVRTEEWVIGPFLWGRAAPWGVPRGEGGGSHRGHMTSPSLFTCSAQLQCILTCSQFSWVSFSCSIYCQNGNMWELEIWTIRPATCNYWVKPTLRKPSFTLTSEPAFSQK